MGAKERSKRLPLFRVLIPFLPSLAGPSARCPTPRPHRRGTGQEKRVLPNCTHADTSLRQLVSIPRYLQNRRRRAVWSGGPRERRTLRRLLGGRRGAGDLHTHK